MITNEQKCIFTKLMNTKNIKHMRQLHAEAGYEESIWSGIVSEIVATDQHINCFLLPEVSRREGAHGYRFIDCMSCS